MIYFTSDWHLGHPGILKHQAARTFPDTDAMDAAIIDACNATVGRNDELWHLGDFAWKASKYGHYRQRLNVRKFHCIMGNHDTSSLRTHCSSLNDMLVRKFNGLRFHLCHYPLVSWSGMHHDSIHLYGHCHGTMEKMLNIMFPNRRSMDVGVDCANRILGTWRPFAIDEILEML